MINLIKSLLRYIKNIAVIGDNTKVEGGIHFYDYLSWKALLCIIIPLCVLIGFIVWINRPKPYVKEIEPKNPSIQEVQTELDKEFVSAKEKALEEYKIGNTAYNNEMFDTAISRFQNALNIVKLPSFYLSLGNSFYKVSSYPVALEHYQAALKLYKEKHDLKGEADALGNIGLIYRAKGDADNALKYHRDALAIFRQIGYRQGEANALGNIGMIYSDKGDTYNALKHLQKAENIFKQIGVKAELEQTENNIKRIQESISKNAK